MEDEEVIITESDVIHPILILPKMCTMLETNCDAEDNVFIHLNITSQDTEGSLTTIYRGFCNVKVIDTYDDETGDCSSQSSYLDRNAGSIIALSDTNAKCTYPDNQSQIWIDQPSPCAYGTYTESEKRSAVCHQTHAGHVTVTQHNTYITQNVYNCNENVLYSPTKEFEHKKFRRASVNDVNQVNTDTNLDDFDCGVFLTHLPEEIVMENENRAREELKYIDLQSENDALKQLMSSDIQSLAKHQKTILYLGPESPDNESVHNIAEKGPIIKCVNSGDVDKEVIIDSRESNPKKYPCGECKQIFYHVTKFKQHMRIQHNAVNFRNAESNETDLTCGVCSKVLKNRQKYQLHCLGHGDPEVECSKCHKVFASKFTLRNHSKLHQRQHKCTHCSKSYSKVKELKGHVAKAHLVHKCESCDYAAKNYSELVHHRHSHSNIEVRESATDKLPEVEQSQKNVEEREDITEKYSNHQSKQNDNVASRQSDLTEDACMLFDEEWMNTDENVLLNSSTPTLDDFSIISNYEENTENVEEIPEPDSVIAKIISTKIFHNQSKKTKQYRNTKVCDVCSKTFDRVSDLKRHLIEHVIRSTLAKTPVNSDGTLSIQCEVCQADTFSRVDRYKEHLREHAKLTLYKCMFCDKSFSDSSNFSKHKKVHGNKFYQCDLCQRKFNSKKTLTQHMDYHKKNDPLPCCYCGKVFHFPSLLKKHIRSTHKREANRPKCRFCQECFKSLKDKWDHEWLVHNVRKIIVDCLLCKSKFRKYSELKRHCRSVHNIDIPPARNLLKNEI